MQNIKEFTEGLLQEILKRGSSGNFCACWQSLAEKKVIGRWVLRPQLLITVIINGLYQIFIRITPCSTGNQDLISLLQKKREVFNNFFIFKLCYFTSEREKHQHLEPKTAQVFTWINSYSSLFTKLLTEFSFNVLILFLFYLRIFLYFFIYLCEH